MSERRVLRMGDPRLRLIAEPVTDFGSPRLKSLIAELWLLMEDYGGVGLAAPQIGVSERIVIFAMEAHPRHPEWEPIAPTVLVNPVITFLSTGHEFDWEGCLSVPGMRGYVPRCPRIRYRGADEDGRPVDAIVEGYHARIVQHECDHLDGILYPQRMDDLSHFGFSEEIAAGLDAADLVSG